jgi:endogenous inhibitor of DNA gyrase (YacG/DUF329 family)
MTTDSNAPAAPAKSCPNCGNAVEGRGRGMGKTFCSSTCRVDFSNRQKLEGQVVIALLKASMETRHASHDSEDPEERRRARVCRAARRELTAIVKEFRGRDAAAGRGSVVDYVEQLLDIDEDGKARNMYMDRTRG